MTKEKWTAKLERKSSLFGYMGGGEFDDLDQIANELGTSKETLLNSDIIKDIHIKKIKIRHGDWIDAIQFSYKIVTNDNTYFIEGNKHGSDRAEETIINLEDDEYILRTSGEITTKSSGRIGQLNFLTYIPSKKQIKTYGSYGNSNGTPFDLPALACIFGRSGADLDAFGIYEAKIFSNYEENRKQWDIEKNQMQFQLTELQKEIAQLQQLSTLLFPNQPYNFNQLQQEIARLKHQELAPQAREERVKFEQLINVAKSKAGNSEKIVELLLETQRQAVQTSEVSLRDKLNGKIEAYQNVLESSLTKKEIQTLLTKQTELHQLEKHLASLQQNQEQVAQIVQKESRGFPEPSKK